MGRKALWLTLAVMMMIGVGWAREQAGPADPATARPADADPIWNPSLDQMVSWVQAGMEAAAAEMYLSDVAGVDTWTWSGDATAGEGRRLQWAVLLTPQFVGTVTGYEGAWHQDLWERIQAGEQHTVALELAIAVLKEWRPGTVSLVLGLANYGDASSSPQVAAWMRMWHSTGSGSAISAPQEEQREGLPTAHWAALYYLSKVGMDGTKGYEVAIQPQQALWDASREVESPDDSLTQAVGSPEVGANVLRVYVGAPAEWAFVEWPL